MLGQVIKDKEKYKLILLEFVVHFFCDRKIKKIKIKPSIYDVSKNLGNITSKYSFRITI